MDERRHLMNLACRLLGSPVAVATSRHLFSDIDWAPWLELLDVTRFANGVVVLVYRPK